MTASLAQLLAFWVNEDRRVDEQDLVILVLETIRDDIPQAQTKDGRRVADPTNMQGYLNEQIAELRTLWKRPSSNVAD